MHCGVVERERKREEREGGMASGYAPIHSGAYKEKGGGRELWLLLKWGVSSPPPLSSFLVLIKRSHFSTLETFFHPRLLTIPELHGTKREGVRGTRKKNAEEMLERKQDA